MSLRPKRDPRAGRPTNVLIGQGEHAVSSCADTHITTILGSCVATCLWDPEAEIGGMNHILLPNEISHAAIVNLHGFAAMEVLLNALLKSGAAKHRLRAKLFGGARMVRGLSTIGAQNCAFAKTFLRNEGIPCDAESLGGNLARRILFSPTTGQAKQKMLQKPMVEKPIVAVTENEIELF